MGVLFFVPWFGDVQEEARLVIASIAAFVGMSVIWLIVDLIKAPQKMHQLAQNRLAEFATALELRKDVAMVRKAMMDRCKEGRELLARNADAAEFEEWKAKSLQTLRDHYSDNHVYEFEYEVRFLRKPRDDDQRFEWLVAQLEQTALSWTSEAERLQQMFNPKTTAMPWLEREATQQK